MSLAATPVIKRSIRYAAGKPYERSEILRHACCHRPKNLARRKRSIIYLAGRTVFPDAKMIRETLLTKDNVELYLQLSTVVDDPSVTLSGNTILIASNNIFAAEILDSTLAHTVRIQLAHGYANTDSAGILEDSYEEVELSIRANLISSFYSR